MSFSLMNSFWKSFKGNDDINKCDNLLMSYNKQLYMLIHENCDSSDFELYICSKVLKCFSEQNKFYSGLHIKKENFESINTCYTLVVNISKNYIARNYYENIMNAIDRLLIKIESLNLVFDFSTEKDKIDIYKDKFNKLKVIHNELIIFTNIYYLYCHDLSLNNLINDNNIEKNFYDKYNYLINAINDELHYEEFSDE